MATTFTLISSVTVGAGGASSIDFTSIPSTYTDLVVKFSLRSSNASAVDNLKLTFNGSSSGYSDRRLYGTGSAAGSDSDTPAYFEMYAIDGNSATASTFANGEIYIPNYAGSNYKSVSGDLVGETNATAINMGLNASLWSNTSGITSMTLKAIYGTTLQQYSTAYLYGIKNS